MRQQLTVGDLSCSATSIVDSITDYNEFYSILLRRADNFAGPWSIADAGPPHTPPG